jgi:hypothetical protein
MCLVEALSSAGARVDVFMPDSGPFPSITGKVARYPYPRPFRFWCGGIRSTFGHWREVYQGLRIDRMFGQVAYDLIIGVNSEGIIKGYQYARRFNLPLVYLSFEVFFMDELSSSAEIQEKKQECIASRFANLVITQDHGRGLLLEKENALSPEKFTHLPVSPGGVQRVKKSDCLRRRFRLPEGQTVVLHAGSLSYWTYTEELLENVITWPEDFALVVHTRYRPTKKDRYVQKIRQARLPNVFLSSEPLDMDQYEQLVASADIGLVLYKPAPPSRYTQKNIQSIGLSSGKFSFFMKYGIPVISIKQQTYEELLTEYTFGENIDSLNNMPQALMRIKSDYSHYRLEAQRLFADKLDFDIHWPRLADRLLEIV